MHEPLLNIEELIDGQRFRRFNFSLLAWSFLAMLADGYDLAGLASAAPALAHDWHLAPKAFAPALSASLFGILFGAPLLGHLGDRIGRKPAIVAGCLIYGIATLGTAWTSNLDQIALLRFVTGIGLGGLMPNVIALNAELAPERLRAALIVLTFTGITTGAGLPGAIQAWLIPSYGWQIVFWIGGLAPLLIAGALALGLPESVRYLGRLPHRRRQLLSTLRRLRPDVLIADEARFVAEPGPIPGRPALLQLLSGRFAFITPVLWVCFATALMGNFFLNSWLPLILQGRGLTPRENGLAILCYHNAGTVGGLLVALILGRFGIGVIAVLFLGAALATASIGLPGLSYAALLGLVLLAGFSIIGVQFCNNAASGLLYPTEFRSSGAGWALGIGRFGSIAGPLLGGLLIGRVSLQQLFLLAALPMLAGLLASLLLVRLWRRLKEPDARGNRRRWSDRPARSA